MHFHTKHIGVHDAKSIGPTPTPFTSINVGENTESQLNSINTILSWERRGSEGVTKFPLVVGSVIKCQDKLIKARRLTTEIFMMVE